MTDPTPDPIRDLLAEVARKHDLDPYDDCCRACEEAGLPAYGYADHLATLQAAALRLHLTSEDTIERAAQRLAEADYWKWNELGDWGKDNYRRIARTVLGGTARG